MLVLLAIASRPLSARAQAEPADPFEKAVELQRESRCAEAIPLFEQSRRLGPGPGKDFNLASCYEVTGRWKSAWSLFLDAAEAAEVLGKKALARNARDHAAAIEPHLSRLTIVVPPAVRALPSLQIELDGQPLKDSTWNRPLPVDPGAHLIAVTATGKRRVELSTPVDGPLIERTIPLLEDATPPRPPPPAAPAEVVAVRFTAFPVVQPGHPAPRAPGLGGQRIAALAAAGGALVGLGVGSATGVLALNRDAAWLRAFRADCTIHGDCRSTEAIQAIQAIEAERSRFATISTGAFVAGGALLAGATGLWFTAPSGSGPRVLPTAAGAPAGATLTGSF
jgi:hypothetical protein